MLEFVVPALALSMVLGAIAWNIVERATRSRCRAPLARGRAECAILYGGSIICGPLILFVIASGLGATMRTLEVALIGIVVAAPVSATFAWMAGELLSGPTRRNWRPMIIAFMAAQAGLWAGLMAFPYLFAGTAAELPASLVVSGFAGSWAYRRWRSEVAIHC
jgi:hypothetical protein